MRFEIKLGLITVLMLGTTFSFLLYKKIQKRKAEIALVEKTSPPGEYVNVPQNSEDSLGTDNKKGTVRSQQVTDSKNKKRPFPTPVHPTSTPFAVSSFAANEQSTPSISISTSSLQQQSSDPFLPDDPAESSPASPVQMTEISKDDSEFSPPAKSPFPVVAQSESSIKQKERAAISPQIEPFGLTAQTKVQQKPTEPALPPSEPDAMKNPIEQNPFDFSTAKKKSEEFENKQQPIVKKTTKQPSSPAFDFGSTAQVDPFQEPASQKSIEKSAEKAPVQKEESKSSVVLTPPSFHVDPFSPAEQKAKQLPIPDKEPVDLKLAEQSPPAQFTQPEQKSSLDSIQTWESQSEPLVQQDQVVKESPVEPSRLRTPATDQFPLTPIPEQTLPASSSPSQMAQSDLQPQPDPGFGNSEFENQHQQVPPSINPFAPVHQSVKQEETQVAHLRPLPPTQRIGFSTEQQNPQNVERIKTKTSPQTKIYVAQPGDNYWKISRRRYGSARYFAALAKFNQSRIPNPKKLRPGMKVLIPDSRTLESNYPQYFKHSPLASTGTIQQVSAKKRAGFYLTPTGQPMYRVGTEDTLTSIAHAHLGRASRWTQIYELNKQVLKTENRLKIGAELRLPRDASRISVLPTSPTYR